MKQFCIGTFLLSEQVNRNYFVLLINKVCNLVLQHFVNCLKKQKKEEEVISTNESYPNLSV